MWCIIARQLEVWGNGNGALRGLVWHEGGIAYVVMSSCYSKARGHLTRPLVKGWGALILHDCHLSAINGLNCHDVVNLPFGVV